MDVTFYVTCKIKNSIYQYYNCYNGKDVWEDHPINATAFTSAKDAARFYFKNRGFGPSKNKIGISKYSMCMVQVHEDIIEDDEFLDLKLSNKLNKDEMETLQKLLRKLK